MPPFPITFLVAYLFKVYESSGSYSSLVMTHAALKWFHFFGLINGANPLDSSTCHNLLEAAKRDKPVSVNMLISVKSSSFCWFVSLSQSSSSTS